MLCYTPQQFIDLMTDSTKVMSDFRIIQNTIAMVAYDATPGFEKPTLASNLNIAAFVTSQARIKLYSIMNILKDRVLYCDTDSAIYISKPGFPEPETGEYLGMLKNELKPNVHMTHFVGAGPKNYGYRLNTGEECMKIRGFTLNYDNSKLLNIESMTECIKDELKTVEVEDMKITRNKYTQQVKTVQQKKKYRFVFDKRFVNKDTMMSYPFGY